VGEAPLGALGGSRPSPARLRGTARALISTASPPPHCQVTGFSAEECGTRAHP
jgi:hypothetical protein